MCSESRAAVPCASAICTATGQTALVAEAAGAGEATFRAHRGIALRLTADGPLRLLLLALWRDDLVLDLAARNLDARIRWQAAAAATGAEKPCVSRRQAGSDKDRANQREDRDAAWPMRWLRAIHPFEASSVRRPAPSTASEAFRATRIPLTGCVGAIPARASRR